ncbi:MAG: response regulator [Oligoflexus sp.]|nr:response regulator [Oligoflexus sp.]
MILTKEEEEIVYRLAEKLTGSSQSGSSRKTVLVHNVMRRIQATSKKGLGHYLEYALNDKAEYKQLLSSLTIHFTNWFRESDTYSQLFDEIIAGRSTVGPVRILCAACSTGEEVFSLGLFLESKRQTTPNFDYKIVGVDIDPVSIAVAKKSVYRKERAKDIPLNFHRLINFGSGPSEGYFTLEKDLRQRSVFYAGDLRKLQSLLSEKNEASFDAILCKNVLIYFDARGVHEITEGLVKQLNPGGILSIGHSEVIQATQLGLSSRGKSLFRRPLAKVASSTRETAGRVLVVDDSLLIRKILMSTLAGFGFEVEAVDSAAAASRAISGSAFDLITLDLHMPEIDGITWLTEQRARGLKTPVVIVSDASPSEADDVLGVLSTHAQDYVEKKDLNERSEELGDRLKAIIAKKNTLQEDLVRGLQAPKLDVWKKSLPELIVVGASTGGTEALVKMLGLMSSQSPPVLVVQHITTAFSIAFAHRLAKSSGLILGEMVQDEVLKKGHLYIALGDYHIGIKKQGPRSLLDISYSAKEHSHRPSVDYLFRTAARTKQKVLGCLLTGMGKDGALGLLDIKLANGMTLAQDEASCVVYGMPREAAHIGATQFVGDLSDLRREIDSCIHNSSHAA